MARNQKGICNDTECKHCLKTLEAGDPPFQVFAAFLEAGIIYSRCQL